MKKLLIPMMKAVINLQLKNAIILAAGASERLGQPKALVEINGETLTEIIIKRLKKHNLDIIIVTRSNLEQYLKSFGEKVVINPKPENGRTGSIQCGLREIKGKRCIIVPIDRPGFSDQTLKRLIKSDITTCPSKNGKGGHPVALTKEDCDRILSSEPSTPLRDLINPSKIEVEDEYLHLNIDFPEDITILKNMIK
mgnify:CR=1 FL=1|jgi:molybdenum cofactor cytidylyltransferase